MTPLETTLAAGLIVAVVLIAFLSLVCRDQDRLIADLLHANDWQARLLALRRNRRRNRRRDDAHEPPRPKGLRRWEPPR
jgi:hypothetical protein